MKEPYYITKGAIRSRPLLYIMLDSGLDFETTLAAVASLKIGRIFKCRLHIARMRHSQDINSRILPPVSTEVAPNSNLNYYSRAFKKQFKTLELRSNVHNCDDVIPVPALRKCEII